MAWSMLPVHMGPYSGPAEVAFALAISPVRETEEK